MTAHRSRGPRLFLSGVRFVVSEGQSEQSISLPEQESHYVRDVLRLRVGDPIELGDSSSGLLWEGQVCGVTKQVTVNVQRMIPGLHPTPLAISILCALCKGEKNDQICDWATELGCHEIVFWQSSRSIVRVRDERDCARKAERLTAIALAAAQQSKQSKPPKVSVHRTLASALAALTSLDNSTKLVCSLDPQAVSIGSIQDVTTQPSALILAVGPEGDFSPEEYATLTTECGFIPVSLGQSVLRSELAVVAAMMALRYSLRS